MNFVVVKSPSGMSRIHVPSCAIAQRAGGEAPTVVAPDALAAAVTYDGVTGHLTGLCVCTKLDIDPKPTPKGTHVIPR